MCMDGTIPGGVDSPSYGLQCSDWAMDYYNGLGDADCLVEYEWYAIYDGFTSAEMDEIRTSCPLTCGMC